MSITKNIQMSEFNRTDYDILLPQTRLDFELGNEYVWEKNKHIENWTEYESVNLWASNGNTTIYYGTTKSLGNQKACFSVSEFTSACAGFYFKIYGSDTLYYGDPNGTCTISKGYFVFPAKTFISESDEISYVNSPDPNAYPPAVSDGYTYTALGQLGNKVQIATGSYVGTGAYGSSNPNSLTFGFVPEIVIITKNGARYGYGQHAPSAVSLLNGQTSFSAAYNGSATLNNTVSWGTTVSWYISGYVPGDVISVAPSLQLNNGETYYYIAIG